MSEPSSIPLDAYSIDPDRQCGVLKSDGTRCSVRLNCLLHNDAEKNAIPRSKTYKQLLKLQPPSLALDSRPRLGVPLLPPSGPIAWISDPNVHCGVPLAESAGLPCQADIATCANHSPEQMSLVQGRCASFDGIRRAVKANRDAAGKKVPFDADIHCGVSKSDGKQCTRNLRCTHHTNATKQAVPRNTGFQGRYFELLGLQLALLPAFELLVPTGSSEVAKNVVDTSVQCGVRRHTTICPNALNCSSHSQGEKLKVLRNAELETLLHRQSPMSAITDRYCGVLLPDGERCGNDFECGLHTLADKKQDTCESELKAGEAALKVGEAALKVGEAALKAREARLREELASREARLADEGVRDARMAATMQDTLKALKAELAAELEKRTQEMQNERDLALSNTRAQRGAIFQSIRDLRISLRDRSAAYQDELAGIATQIDNLRLQRDNVASRYQADKAQMEEEIDGLQEKITALLE
jgi:hypothetical protein